MYPDCPNCKFKYERAPGYFLGSTYINYGLTAVTLTALYVGFHFGLGYENRTLTPVLVLYCVLFPLFCFRYARSLWLSMDCYFDRSGFDEDETQPMHE